MVVFAHILSHPLVVLALRATLGGYLIYMGRVYYADPLASFRGSARPLPFDPWVRQVLRAVAGFCLWGGCFILGTAIATRILDLHGTLLALALVVIASIATWILLPHVPSVEGRSRIWKM
jgi:uncharacterized membrane-anchored protein